MAYIDFCSKVVAVMAGRDVSITTIVIELEGCSTQIPKGSLVIGHGSGGLALMIVTDPTACVVDYMHDCIERDAEMRADALSVTTDELVEADPLWNLLGDFIIKNDRDCFHYDGWSIEDYVDLFNDCTSRGLHIPHTSIKDSEWGSLHNWLMLSLGEYIWFCQPQLIEGLDPAMLALFNPGEAIWKNVLPTY